MNFRYCCQSSDGVMIPSIVLELQVCKNVHISYVKVKYNKAMMDAVVAQQELLILRGFVVLL